MRKNFHHLTHEERCQIYALKKSEMSHSAIARQLGRDRRTIGREIARNSGARGYRHQQAHEKSTKRRSHASQQRQKATPELVNWIEEKVNMQWSPQQISGRMKREKEVSLSHEWIYQHIWADKKAGGNLYQNLRHGGKKYNKRKGKYGGRGRIPDRVGIEERPDIVEEKSRKGDWELDTVIGAGHKGAIVTAVERMSKYCQLEKSSDKTAHQVSAALKARLGAHKNSVLTLTADNGKEFAGHKEISKALDADFYFARPYHSWERGLNEHTNGLIRQYLPKSTSFENVSQQEIDKIEELLNNRPRKVLNYQTPHEVFFSSGLPP